MIGSKCNVLLPVEVINRELDTRLLLAVAFAEPDRRIYVGQHNVLDAMVPRLKGGIYVGKTLFKSLFPTDLKYYEMLRRSDFRVVHLDEEGGVFSGDGARWRAILDSRLDPQVLAQDDYLCTWGGFQQEHYLDRAPNLKGSTRVVGHPRFDLYLEEYRALYEEEARRLRERHGSFVLVNTNLAVANNSFGREYMFSPPAGYDLQDARRRLAQVGRWAETSKTLADIIALVHRMSVELPERRIVVRPHPQEDMSFYETALNSLENVDVVHEGPVGPWILAAEALVHDGCTTSLEAHFAGKPVITFQTSKSTGSSVRIANHVGLLCQTPEEVLNALQTDGGMHGEALAGRFDDVDRSLLANLDGAALPRLMAVMQEAIEHGATEYLDAAASDLKWMEARRRLVEGVKSPLRRAFPKRHARHRAFMDLFYGFDRNLINRKLALIQEILDKEISSVVVSDRLVVIEGVGG
ncbi:MAG: hypothetical protein GWP44_09510 [Proteobacteria bacterium]|nr:hypothetical protein [Pseudomonadota bacterium]